MAHLIDKDAVLAEIEKRILILQKNPYENHKTICHLDAVKQLLNTLEVKEVDLEKYLKEDIEDILFDLDGVAVKGATHYLTVEDVKNIAKHFFELGVNTGNPLTWEDMKLIWNITDEMDNMPEEEFYQEVLKRFKAQKGEEV